MTVDPPAAKWRVRPGPTSGWLWFTLPRQLEFGINVWLTSIKAKSN
jgi:hypothetical protein